MHLLFTLSMGYSVIRMANMSSARVVLSAPSSSTSLNRFSSAVSCRKTSSRARTAISDGHPTWRHLGESFTARTRITSEPCAWVN